MNDRAWRDMPITSLYGVGKVKAQAYARLGIERVEDLLMHYPRAYENRGDVCLLSQASEEGKVAVILTVATQPRSATIRRGMTLLKLRAYDDSGTCEITFFNQPYLADAFVLGESYRFYGKVERVGKKYAMSAPAFERMPAEDAAALPALYPIYPLTQGLSQKQIASHVYTALRQAATDEDDPLPGQWRTTRGLCSRAYALRQIHCPESMEALSAAKRRLIYDELLQFSLGMAMSRRRVKAQTARSCTNGDASALIAQLPYVLTGAQQRVIEEIRADMAKSVPMSRMVVGDVGCGKTVIAAAAMLFAVQSGGQAVLMAPTEILARQHAAELTPLLGRLGVRCALLIGATPAAEKRSIKQSLCNPDDKERIDVVIGTQALLQQDVTLAAPALVVTDEQHRFGVNQRAVLSEKNRFSHVLVMSATPIPRSLALGLYGDLEISHVDEMPRGRQRVETFVVDGSYRKRLNGFIAQQVGEGGQVYVVCPAIEAADEDEADTVPLDAVSVRGDTCETASSNKALGLTSALQHAKELSTALPQLQVACLHGKMKPAEKDAIMQRFAAGEIQVLVSTTVIEVGVNVPNACLMIVENAERFGLSQLHQLRGRVGRGARKSYCVLVKGEHGCGDAAARRLETMKNQYDGFEIARHDLLQRGPGDFLRSNAAGDGTMRQSGGIHFRLADQCDDEVLLRQAFDDGRQLVAQDAELSGYPLLRVQVERMFAPDVRILS